MDLENLATIKNLCGVDEVGRGPLAGDVVAAAVILDPLQPIEGLMDSKKLSEKKRNNLYQEICAKALDYSIARAGVPEIDELNIFHASLLAMQRAVNGLKIVPQMVLVDGKFCPDIPYPKQAIVKGDALVEAISAASILAKVVRDREMQAFEETYPGYGFAKHKGYPTKQHIQALNSLGICPIHRLSFKPVQKLLEA